MRWHRCPLRYGLCFSARAVALDAAIVGFCAAPVGIAARAVDLHVGDVETSAGIVEGNADAVEACVRVIEIGVRVVEIGTVDLGPYGTISLKNFCTFHHRYASIYHLTTACTPNAPWRSCPAFGAF